MTFQSALYNTVFRGTIATDLQSHLALRHCHLESAAAHHAGGFANLEMGFQTGHCALSFQ